MHPLWPGRGPKPPDHAPDLRQEPFLIPHIPGTSALQIGRQMEIVGSWELGVGRQRADSELQVGSWELGVGSPLSGDGLERAGTRKGGAPSLLQAAMQAAGTAPLADKMQIYVKTLEGKTIPLEVRNSSHFAPTHAGSRLTRLVLVSLASNRNATAPTTASLARN